MISLKIYTLGRYDKFVAISDKNILISNDYNILSDDNGITGIIWSVANDNKSTLKYEYTDGNGHFGETYNITEMSENQYLNNVSVNNIGNKKIMIYVQKYLDWKSFINGNDGNETDNLCWEIFDNNTDIEIESVSSPDNALPGKTHTINT